MHTESGYILGRIKLLSGRCFNRLLAECGLTEFNGEQGKILYVLWQEEGISSTDLSEKTGLAINTLTDMLDSMERKELLIRQRCPKDARKKLIFLTEKGKALKEDAAGVNEEMAKIFFRGFTVKEIARFEKDLLRIAENFAEENKMRS